MILTCRSTSLNYDKVERAETVREVDVVVIDDNEGICWVFQQALALCNLSCLAVTDATEGFRAVIRHKPHLAIIDIKLGAMNGFEVARLIRQKNRDVKILFITGYRETLASGKEMDDENILGILEKPFNIPDLLEMIAGLFGLPAPQGS